ncbi:hypothetical protein ACP4OV_005560 [Aristida adscensionis]
MPPSRRARAPAGGEGPCAGERLSPPPAESSTRKRRKLTPRVEDDGFPLGDEALLLVFAGAALDTADLARCAATCRRWRRLVTREAEFICRRLRPACGGARALALAAAFFLLGRHDGDEDSAAPPLRFLPLRPFSLDCAVLDGSLRRASRAATLRLAVCNPSSGDVCVLPALSGKDKPGNYACAVLTAADDLGDAAAVEAGPAAFRMVLLYRRRGFTACRSYSSGVGGGAWGPERRVGGAQISSRRLGEMDAGGVAAGGAVLWLSENVVFRLRVDTLTATRESLPAKAHACMRYCFCRGGVEMRRRLAVSPDGRPCVVQVGRGGAGVDHDGGFMINVLCRDDGRWRRRWVWDRAQDVDLGPWLPPPAAAPGGERRVCLRAACEKSGVVFFATGGDRHAQQPDLAMYALDLGTKAVRRVPAAPPGRCSRARRSS